MFLTSLWVWADLSDNMLLSERRNGKWGNYLSHYPFRSVLKPSLLLTNRIVLHIEAITQSRKMIPHKEPLIDSQPPEMTEIRLNLLQSDVFAHRLKSLRSETLSYQVSVHSSSLQRTQGIQYVSNRETCHTHTVWLAIMRATYYSVSDLLTGVN